MKNGVARSNRPLTEKHLQVGILAHGVGEVAGHVGVAEGRRRTASTTPASSGGRAMGVVPDLVDVGAVRKVGLFGGVLQLAIQVVVKGGDEGAADAGAGGVIAGILARGIGVGAFEAGIVAAQDHALVAHQFLAEAHRTDAQVGLFDELLAEPGIAGQFGGDGVHLGGGRLCPCASASA